MQSSKTTFHFPNCDDVFFFKLCEMVIWNIQALSPYAKLCDCVPNKKYFSHILNVFLAENAKWVRKGPRSADRVTRKTRRYQCLFEALRKCFWWAQIEDVSGHRSRKEDQRWGITSSKNTKQKVLAIVFKATRFSSIACQTFSVLKNFRSPKPFLFDFNPVLSSTLSTQVLHFTSSTYDASFFAD